MSEPTMRDLVVWSAYIGTALDLPTRIHDLGDDTLAQLAKSKAVLDSSTPGTLKGAGAIVKACVAGVKACELQPGTHPSVMSKVRVVAVNLQAVADQISGGAAEPVGDDDEEPVAAGDGKVDCPCGKRHAAGSKVLERHTKSKG